MLAPETRVLLTDALRPPAGHRVDVAVATTYSLDLTALLLAPMTFALHDDDMADLDSLDPIKLLEAVRRHAEHTTVFAQAGAIGVPSSYRRILTFTEDCVREVAAPSPGTLFHPKIWALRFADLEGGVTHRLVCLSRNLTFDRSWDTALVLDEHDGESTDATIETAPLVDFLGELPQLTTRPLGRARTEQVTSLQQSLGAVDLAAPSGFTTGALLPLGFHWSGAFPVPAAARSAVISPFLDATTVRGFIKAGPRRMLLSRPESLDRLGAQALRGLDLFVLQRAAEREVGADLDEPLATAPGTSSVPEGLHAKTFIFEQGRQTTLVTGSANATSAGTTRNVEFDVVLTGPTRLVGVSAMWEGSKEAPGFGRLCQPYAAADQPQGPDETEATAQAIEQYHALLAQDGPVAEVTDLGDGAYRLGLTLSDRRFQGVTTVRPVTLPAGWFRDLEAPPLQWQTLAVGSITPLFVVSTTAGTGAARCTVAAVLTAELRGDPEHRRRDALADILKTQADVLRYLAFLLGDAALLGGDASGLAGSWDMGDRPGGTRQDIVLFEPLVRALSEGGSALKRVASLHDELAKLPNAAELVPAGWGELWEAVWSAHLRQTGRSAGHAGQA